MTSMIRQERGDEQDAHAGMDENRGGPAGGVCHLQALSAWACGDRLATRNGSCRLIADIQFNSGKPMTSSDPLPPFALSTRTTASQRFSDIPAPTVFIDHQGDPASPNSSKNRLCRFWKKQGYSCRACAKCRTRSPAIFGIPLPGMLCRIFKGRVNKWDCCIMY